jgi:hypothetical protein
MVITPAKAIGSKSETSRKDGSLLRKPIKTKHNTIG